MTDVHLHWIEVREEADLDRLRALLDDDERARTDRFHFHRDRVLFATAHAFLRNVLARYIGGAPQFVQVENGKPELAGRRVRFNLSHTRGLVLVGVTEREDLGVDVETMERRDLQALAQRVFSEEERASWDGASMEWFYDRWTLKESYIKATGIGLFADLLAAGFWGNREEWQFHGFAPSARHRAAAAIRTRDTVRWLMHREEFPALLSP